MELTHTFTVPTTIDETWAKFQDIADLAECFPGAQVTSVTGDSFEGTVKVKLGPIALVYAGSGSFVSKDEAAHSFVVEAKGRDKRGNGTAGATATLTMNEDGAGTAVEVHTDLAITGKPAQFGRGVMQDVSDKLLGQFVACLEQRTATEQTAPEPAATTPPEGAATAEDGAASMVTEEPAAASVNPASPAAAEAAAPQASAPRPASAQPSGSTSGSSRAGGNDDALDLGATVLPVLIKSYGKQAAVGLAGLLGLVLLVRLLRRR